MNPNTSPLRSKFSLLRFDVFSVSLDAIRSLRSPLVRIQKCDGNLAKQVRSASASMSLNIAEGRKRRGRDQAHLWRVAAGSADEVCAALLVAEACGYVQMADIETALDALDRVLAMLWRLTNARS